jgi:UDP-3-O-acyl N-acetylglucosamine deacetylase
MDGQRNQHTIARPCSVRGRGYWSGLTVDVRLRPAPADTGIRFIRVDQEGHPSVPAALRCRQSAQYRTTLATPRTRVEMVEHLLAALYALEVDNCLVEIDGPELPGLDGSSGPYVEALRSAGLVMQAATRPRIVVDRVLRVGSLAAWVEMSPSPDGRMHAEYRLDYGPASTIRAQAFGCVIDGSRFTRDLADARTFVTSDQAEQLQAQRLALHVTERDLVVFDHHGPRTPLRYADEPARHKLLDLVGDLALAGCDLVGCFVSYRGGHQLNAELASQLLHLQQAGNLRRLVA